MIEAALAAVAAQGKAKAEGKTPSAKDAYHKDCKGCHEEANKAKKAEAVGNQAAQVGLGTASSATPNAPTPADIKSNAKSNVELLLKPPSP